MIPSGVHRLIYELFLRILTWTAIINVLFRCPTSPEQCDDNSPLLCKQYFQAKNVMSPIIKPYYDTHAAPYVDLSRPYCEAVNGALLAPAQAYAARHAVPLLLHAQSLALDQWQKAVEPQIENIRQAAREWYYSFVGPHVIAVLDASSEYYEISRTNILQTYHELLLPAYIFAKPHANTAYEVASNFTMNTAIPSATWFLNKTYVFLADAVLPQVRSVYAETVEPQLVRIGQRLGRHNGSSKSKQQVNDGSSASEPLSSFTKPPISHSWLSSASTLTISSSATLSNLQVASTDSSEAPIGSADISQAPAPRRTDLLVEPPPVESNESERRRLARIEVTDDLVIWQDKFMNAAETGAKEIEEKIVEICERTESQEVDTIGKEVLTRFLDSFDEETAALRLEIMAIVGSVPNKGEAADQVTVAVKRAGISLKERAQGIRTWREAVINDVQMAINQAAHSHFHLIDDIRDLAIQKIGMKWAWMDGVTYKDWRLFHHLKTEFTKWRNELEQKVVNHPSLAKVVDAADDVEDVGMAYARDAALELKRLKEVGHLKVITGDAGENFDLSKMKQAAESIMGPHVDERKHAEPDEGAREPGTLQNHAPIESDESNSPLGGGDTISSGKTTKWDETSLAWDDFSSPGKEEASSNTHVVPDYDSLTVDDLCPEKAHGSTDEYGDTVDTVQKSEVSAASISSLGFKSGHGDSNMVADESDASGSPEIADDGVGEDQGQEPVEDRSSQAVSDDDINSDQTEQATSKGEESDGAMTTLRDEL